MPLLLLSVLVSIMALLIADFITKYNTVKNTAAINAYNTNAANAANAPILLIPLYSHLCKFFCLNYTMQKKICQCGFIEKYRFYTVCLLNCKW